MRRSELILLLAFVAALIGAGIIGLQLSPGLQFDRRLSTHNRGPEGALALSRTLQALDVRVERMESPLFRLAADESDLLASLELSSPPTRSELHALRDYVETGGSLFIAAPSGMEGCFSVGLTGLQDGEISPAATPAGIGELPASTRRLALLTGDSIDLDEPLALPTVPARESPEEEGEAAAADTGAGTIVRAPGAPGCRIRPIAADTLLADTAGHPLALLLRFAGGGRVTVLADGTYVSNESLRETDAGALAIPWMLAGEPERIRFDEYHHGYGRTRSLWLVAAAWLVSRPGGWTILQICLAAAIALTAAAIRFGPARSAVERKRRSALEHLDALTRGLRRARGREAAIELLIEGLRRRSSRGMARREGSRDSLIAWLDTVAVATATPVARQARQTLARLAREADSEETVLEAAQMVEILWNEMGRPLSG